MNSWVAIAPHFDDEAIGLAALIQQRAIKHIIWVTDSSVQWGPSRPRDFTERYIKKRREEALRICKDFRIKPHFLEYGNEYLHRLEGRHKIALVDAIEEIIRESELTDVLIPSPVDGHVEHTICSALGMAATVKAQATPWYYSISESLDSISYIAHQTEDPVIRYPRKMQLVHHYYEDEWVELLRGGYPLRDHDEVMQCK